MPKNLFHEHYVCSFVMHHSNTYFAIQAAYKIGGRSVNAYSIEMSILGCRPHRPMKVKTLYWEICHL